MRLTQALEERGELLVIRSNRNNRYIVTMNRDDEKIRAILETRKEPIGDNLSHDKMTRDTGVTSIGDKDVTSTGDTGVTLIINEPSVNHQELHGDVPSPDEKEASHRKPSAHDVIRGELAEHFSAVTGIKQPKTETVRQKKSAAVRWWNPIRDIAEACNWDSAMAIKLIDAVVDHLRGSCTIASPKSIVNTAIAASTGNVPGLTIPRDKPKTRIVIIGGEQREVIA